MERETFETEERAYAKVLGYETPGDLEKHKRRARRGGE